MTTATLTATSTPPARIAPPIALGTLVLVPSLRDPRLLLLIKCPRCRREHVHSWSDDVLTDEPTPRVPHCANVSPSTPQYLVGPADSAANAEVLRKYARRCEAAESTANVAT